MAHDNGVYLVYSVEDGEAWSNYLVDVLTKVDLDVKRLELDSSGSLPASFNRFRRGRAVVLLATPAFVQSLRAGPSNVLDMMVNQKPPADGAELVALFLCGAETADFEGLDSQRRRLSERFLGLDRWKVVDHEQMAELPRIVCDMVKRSALTDKPKQKPPSDAKKPQQKTMNFKLVPEDVCCEVQDRAIITMKH